ncbi:MAG TPA: bifunctional O-acetylhomoserine aminocarboxypropyltransferase/cysteine synthase [Gammaproteobacteria bacterium]|jgi:O-acetylhomoserine (thiol)-lyase|nr:bifunctional O-acetylhomoserine aminocarboxypropyltransferase/cysteine synthase [Gammaproteobacteria bacterium]
MAGPFYPRFETLCIHAGQRTEAEAQGQSSVVFVGNSFRFRDMDHAASLHALATSGHTSSAISNPTVATLESRLAALEGGVAAVATATGMAAIHLAMTSLLNAGDHVVATHVLNPKTRQLLTRTLARLGVVTTFADFRDVRAVRSAMRTDTRLIFAETVALPTGEVTDIEAVAAVAREYTVPLMIDATATTAYLMRPIDLGADIVVQCLGGYVCGSDTAIGGVVIDSGRYDWSSSGYYPQFTQAAADDSGIHFVDDFGVHAYSMYLRYVGLADTGAALSPLSALQILQGLDTLSLRMQRQVDSASAIATFLQAQSSVAAVHWPSLETHPNYALARRVLPRGAGAVLGVSLQGGREAVDVFVRALQLIEHQGGVGTRCTSVLHPATTTHYLYNSGDLSQCGIGDELVQLSVGLEDTDDLISDLSRALRQVAKHAERQP